MCMKRYKLAVLGVVFFGIFGLAAGDDNWRGWKARSLNDLKQTGEPIFIYIKDGATKNNATKAQIKTFESDKLLDHADVKKHMPSMIGAKLTLTDKAIASYLPDWVERTKKNGVLIVVASSDLVKMAVFDGENKSPQSIAAACAMVAKYQNERKEEAAEKRKKDEIVRKEKFAAEVKKNAAGAVPGIDADAAPKTKAKKPAGKDGKEAPEEE